MLPVHVEECGHKNIGAEIQHLRCSGWHVMMKVIGIIPQITTYQQMAHAAHYLYLALFHSQKIDAS